MATTITPTPAARPITASQQAAINRGLTMMKNQVKAPVAPAKAPVAPAKAPVTAMQTQPVNMSSYIPKPTSGKGSSPITTMYDTTNPGQPVLYNLSNNQWVPQQPQQVSSKGMVPTPTPGKGNPNTSGIFR
jgi:hypothetical protein